MEENQYGSDYFVLTDEDGKEEEFEHLATIDYEGETYMAMTPANPEEESDETEIVIFKVEEDEESGRTIINAVIYVSRQMHKAMVIGHAGATIKQIGTEARKDIQTLLERKVHLELWVKVREHWTEDTAFLRDLGLLAESL